MTARRCGNCDGRLRKGLARRAFILDGGVLKPSHVCVGCAAGGVLVVKPAPVTVPTTCKGCGKNLACYCGACVERVGGHVRELSAANAALRSKRAGKAQAEAPAVEAGAAVNAAGGRALLEQLDKTRDPAIAAAAIAGQVMPRKRSTKKRTTKRPRGAR